MLLKLPMWTRLSSPAIAPLPLRASRMVCALAVVLLIGLVTLLRVPFEAVLGVDSPFLFYYPAAVIAAWLGGLESGLLATVLGAAAADYFWMPPLFDMALNQEDTLRVTLFFMACGSASMLIERLHRALEGEKGAKEHLLVALGHSHDAIVTTDTRGRVVFLNAQAQVLSGWDSHEVVGRAFASVFVVLDRQDRTVLQHRFQQALVEGQLGQLPKELVFVNRCGRENLVDQMSSPLVDNQSRHLGAVVLLKSHELGLHESLASRFPGPPSQPSKPTHRRHLSSAQTHSNDAARHVVKPNTSRLRMAQ